MVAGKGLKGKGKSKTHTKSGLDFADHSSAFVDHVLESAPPKFSQQGKTGLRESQIFQTAALSPLIAAPKEPPVKSSSLGKSVKLWYINWGGAQLFWGAWVLVHLLFFGLGFVSYQLWDNAGNARGVLGPTYALAGAAALVLYVNAIFILLPVCRNFISLLRRTSLNAIIPFDKNITFHEATGWSIVFFTLIHIVAHEINFYKLATINPSTANAGQRFTIFLTLNFTTGPGITGWLMCLLLGIITFFAMEKRRKANYERFWYSHHLFILLFVFWQLHGMFCMIKTDREPFCSWKSVGSFWRFWLVGGVIWIYERILREIRSRHITYIVKVIQHPSHVMEFQIKKQKTTYRAGQCIYLSCPEISYFQWHPFTITSSPEEDYISIHIRVVGDFTRALAKAVGCDFREDINEKMEEKTGELAAGGVVVRTWTNTPNMNATLPRVMMDGPFGSASEDYLKYETAFLIGAGNGITPFASILKSIWYRMNYFNHKKPTRLSKVYLLWVVRDFTSVEWFHSLLHAIEEQDTMFKIDISVYLTGKAEGGNEPLATLRAPTHYGRPSWDKVFGNLSRNHPGTDVGVFYCGPPTLSKQLHLMCNRWSDPLPSGTRFCYGKENF